MQGCIKPDRTHHAMRLIEAIGSYPPPKNEIDAGRFIVLNSVAATDTRDAGIAKPILVEITQAGVPVPSTALGIID